MTRKLEARAVELLRQLAASFTEDPDEPINGGDAVEIILELLVEVRPLLVKIEEDAQEQVELEEYRIAAMAKQEDGEIEVDADAIVSAGADEGAYVAAWLWVSNEEAGVEPDEEEAGVEREEEAADLDTETYDAMNTPPRPRKKP